MNARRKALVIVQSTVRDDPRVIRQIDWLLSDGWEVDSLGLGSKPSVGVTRHFEMTGAPSWVRLKPLLGLAHLLPFRLRFALLTEARLPAEAGAAIARGTYSLVVFNDIQLAPWVRNRRIFTPQACSAHIHLDLHEYFPPELAVGAAWRRLLGRYHRWTRAYIANPIFTSRSTVARGIADLYSEELDVAKPQIIRNTPALAHLTPGAVDPENIQLLHHGVASWARGIREIVEAMRLLDDRFTVTFMLMGYSQVIAELRSLAAGIGDRVKFVPPVPMLEISETVNAYDLEIMFYRPTSVNLGMALPNKLFEAVQGRLGLVIGESPMMADVVERYSNGLIIKGWDAEDLARGLNALTVEDVARFKEASHKAARELSAEQERDTFLAQFARSRSA